MDELVFLRAHLLDVFHDQVLIYGFRFAQLLHHFNQQLVQLPQHRYFHLELPDLFLLPQHCFLVLNFYGKDWPWMMSRTIHWNHSEVAPALLNWVGLCFILYWLIISHIHFRVVQHAIFSRHFVVPQICGQPGYFYTFLLLAVVINMSLRPMLSSSCYTPFYFLMSQSEVTILVQLLSCTYNTNVPLWI